jgi:hypothetical protein
MSSPCSNSVRGRIFQACAKAVGCIGCIGMIQLPDMIRTVRKEDELGLAPVYKQP